MIMRVGRGNAYMSGTGLIQTEKQEPEREHVWEENRDDDRQTWAEWSRMKRWNDEQRTAVTEGERAILEQNHGGGERGIHPKQTARRSPLSASVTRGGEWVQYHWHYAVCLCLELQAARNTKYFKSEQLTGGSHLCVRRRPGRGPPEVNICIGDQHWSTLIVLARRHFCSLIVSLHRKNGLLNLHIELNNDSLLPPHFTVAFLLLFLSLGFSFELLYFYRAS